MTNLQIIVNEVISRRICTENEVKVALLKTGMLPVATYQEWQRRGYQVKKGEKSVLMIQIWRHKDKNIKNENTDNEEIEDKHFYKVKAFLFTEKQVERIEELEK